MPGCIVGGISPKHRSALIDQQAERQERDLFERALSAAADIL